MGLEGFSNNLMPGSKQESFPGSSYTLLRSFLDSRLNTFEILCRNVDPMTLKVQFFDIPSCNKTISSALWKQGGHMTAFQSQSGHTGTSFQTFATRAGEDGLSHDMVISTQI